MQTCFKRLGMAAIVSAVIHLDMYQDLTDKTRTVVVIERDGVVKTLSVSNKDLDKESTLNKIEELFNETSN